MKVLVTGGTGFVGSHTVAQLLEPKHDVRLLVRSPERVDKALAPLGIGAVDSVVGDVLDPQSVEKAAEGCDATIHCASVYSLDPRVAGIINRTNVAGTDIVLDVAQRLNHDPIVHVSSFVALIGQHGKTLTSDSNPTRPPGAYSRSKADSDRVARRYQAGGAPVVISYPGSVWGPHDPHLGESCQIARNVLKGRWIVGPRGMIPISDVRDVARLHVAVLEKGRGPRRYMALAHNTSLQELLEGASAATGRRLLHQPLPGWSLRGPIRVLDWAQLLLPVRLPYNHQAVYVASLCHRCDDSRTRADFGIEPPPLADTLSDTIRWMAQAGHLSSRLAGRVAKMSQEP